MTPDLAAVLDLAWTRLEEGARDRHSALRTPAIATIGLGGQPRIRTVVLRGVDRSGSSLTFHTDARSAKVAEVRQNPRATLHAYDPVRQYQIRVEGALALHGGDAVAERAWAEAKAGSRFVYRIEPGPGTPIAGARAYDGRVDETDPTLGREHFTVCVLAAKAMETLDLAGDGHVRARFDLVSGFATWLAP